MRQEGVLHIPGEFNYKDCLPFCANKDPLQPDTVFQGYLLQINGINNLFL
jgi:hypothetical protein